MKTVTIPTCANPFVVIINGKKYLYPAGETVEVSDEIAEVILRHEAAHAKTPGAESEEEESGGSESGGGLPVVEIDTDVSTPVNEGGVILTAEEAASLEAAIALSNNFLVRLNNYSGITLLLLGAAASAESGEFAVVCSLGFYKTDISGSPSFTCVLFGKAEDVWFGGTQGG